MSVRATTEPTTNGRPSIRPATAQSIRAAALAGVAFFILIIVQARLRNGAPAADDPARDVVGYLARHGDRLQVGAVVLGVAMPAALVWLSGVVRLLRAGGAGTVAVMTALGGGVLAAASTVTGALIEGTVATRFADFGAGGTRAVWTMFLMSTGATLLGLLLVIGAVTATSARTRLFARWFTLSGAVLALVSLLGASTIGYSSDAIQAVAGIAVLMDSVWIMLVSVFMWRSAQHAGQ